MGGVLALAYTYTSAYTLFDWRYSRWPDLSWRFLGDWRRAFMEHEQQQDLAQHEQQQDLEHEHQQALEDWELRQYHQSNLGKHCMCELVRGVRPPLINCRFTQYVGVPLA